MPPNINWEEKFGKSPKDMTSAEFRMVVLSNIYEVKNKIEGIESQFAEHLESATQRTRTVNKHELYFKIMGCIFLVFVAPLFVWWLKCLIEGG